MKSFRVRIYRTLSFEDSFLVEAETESEAVEQAKAEFKLTYADQEDVDEQIDVQEVQEAE